MSSVILTNWTVFYADDAAPGAGMKQIKWTGAGAPETNTNTVNELYSALADLFSIAAQNDADDTIPIRAVTPTVYEIGSFDAGDLEPWFIDSESVKHLTGGSLETVGWTRDPLPADGTGDIGIIMVQCSGTGFNITTSDIGDTCTHASGDTGWILDVDAANFRLWIRPTDNALANDFNTGSGTITADTAPNRTATQTANGVSNERLWANIFTIGTIEDNTQMYVYQDFTKITNFWSPGHIDRLFLIDDGFDAGLIDFGLLTIYARQYSKFYDHFSADVSGGGRNAIPIATIADTNNTSGYYQTVFSSSTGTWAAGQTFTKDGDTTREGTVTSATGSNPDTIQYYLSGASLTPFSNGDAVTASSGGPATGNVQTPTSVGPANLAAITITFGAGTDKDIGQGGPQPYDVHINVGGNTLADFYEYTKYITRRGNTADIDGGGQTITGESYITPGELRLSYESQTVNYLEGATLTGQTSGATGIITAVHDSGATGKVIVRDVRGTFQASESILDNQGTPGNGTILASGGIANTSIIKGSPFGTLAGVSFFGARGVWIENMAGADANNYSLIDSNGFTREPPATVPITVNGLVAGDRVSVFRANADNSINKTYLASDASANIAASTSWTVDASTPIPLDTPSSGTIRLVDTSAKAEERRAYTGWSGLVFTLSSAHSGGYYTGDTAYVPYIDEQAAGTSVSKSVQYVTDRSVVTRVRIVGIVPYSITGTLSSTGYSATAIRNPDDIA